MAHLDKLPKPVFCEAFVEDDLMVIRCSPEGDTITSKVREWLLNGLSWLLSNEVVSERVRDGFPLAIQGGGACILIGEADLKSVYSQYVIMHTIGFEPGTCAGVSVTMLTVGPSLEGTLERGK
jgi:hypothetical protein